MRPEEVPEDLIQQAVGAWVSAGVKSYTWETVAAHMLAATLPTYAHELAELVQDPERWERFALKENSMRVYMSTAKKVGRIAELEVESHG